MSDMHDTPASVEVTLEELEDTKQWMRVEHDEEDELIKRLIREAWCAANDYCRTEYTWEASPDAVRLAVQLMVSHYYENRDNPDKQIYISMRTAFENLLYPHRDMEKMF